MYDKTDKRLTGWRLKLSKCFIIPQRYVLGLMGFLAVVNAYNMRVCLSVAINDMTVPHRKLAGDVPDSCPSPGGGDPQGNSTAPPGTPGRHEYAWDTTQQGLILSSFFWGYVVTHMPGGLLAERFGGKHSLGVGILGTAVFTLLTPVVVRTWDWQGLVAIRIIEGLGEGTTYPALNALLAQWVPLGERAKIGTLVYAGGQIGTVVGNAVSGALIEYTGSWESVFYLFGGVTLVWFVLWCALCYSDPHSHPFISDEELDFLSKEIGSKRSGSLSIPWMGMLTSVPLWALVAAQIGHDWGFFTMVTDLPIYMSDVLQYDIATNGLLSSAPYVAMWLVSMGSGWLCDWLIARGRLSISAARKMFTSVASAGPAAFIVLAGYAGCQRALVIALFCVAMGLMGTFYPGMKVNALDLAPNYAGTIMAVVNGVGAITGIITPLLVGGITTDHTIEQWQTVFWVAFGVFMVTNVIFVMYGSAEEQPWNDPSKVRDLEHSHCTDKPSQLAVIDSKPKITT